LNSDGDCSLREAINAANNDSSTNADACTVGTGADTISLPAGTYTLTRDTQLDVSDGDGLTITGAGSATTIIQGHAAAGTATRVMIVSSGAGDFAMSGVTIENSKSTQSGGAMRFAAGSNHSLTITNCKFQNNEHTGTSGGGGALHIQGTTGTIAISGTTFSGNATGANGGGIFNQAGGGYAFNITNSTFSNNNATSGFGGGIDNEGTGVSFTVSNTTISGNTASSDGGGLYVTISGGPPVVISGSTISANDSGRNGGGMWLTQVTGGTFSVKNTTITGNTADEDGGGLFMQGALSATVTLNNVTITGNTADADAGGNAGDGGGIRREGSSSLNVANSIVAANTDASASTKHADCSTDDTTKVVTQGYNLIGVEDAGGCTNFANDSGGEDGDRIGLRVLLVPRDAWIQEPRA